MERATYYLTREPSGACYQRLLDAAPSFCDTIVFIVHDQDRLTQIGLDLLAALEPFRLETRPASEWFGTRLVNGGTALVYRFKLCDLSLGILRGTTERISAWQHPDLPEDLALLRPDGTPWMVTVAHEAYCSFELTPDERNLLEARLPDLGPLVLRAAAVHLILEPQLPENERAVHVVAAGSRDLRELKVAAVANGFRLFEVQTFGIATERDLRERIRVSVGAEKSCSDTWENLEACLKDLGWLPGRWYVLFIEEGERIATAIPQAFARLLLMAYQLSQDWWELRVPFHMIVSGDRSLLTQDYGVVTPCLHQ